MGSLGGPPPKKKKKVIICSTQERVDCSITWSRAQITFTIHTPPPGDGYIVNPNTMTVPEPIAVVKWDDGAQQIETNYPNRAAYTA
jgi:hypothetical protein